MRSSKVKALVDRADNAGYVPVLSGKKRRSMKTMPCPKVHSHTAIVFRPKNNPKGKRVVRCPYCA
jgi:hypothetical protein